MYTLIDDFNGGIISRHRTMAAAAKAMAKFDRAVKRHNGQSSYIPTALLINGKRMTEDQLIDWQEAQYRNQ